jgi:hypothetical protein
MVYWVVISISIIWSILFWRGRAFMGNESRIWVAEPFSFSIELTDITALDVVSTNIGYKKVRIKSVDGKTHYLSPFILKDGCDVLIGKIERLRVKVDRGGNSDNVSTGAHNT